MNSLKFFYFVGKYNSVTRAAEKLFVTQSAVSKQIYNLEEVLKVALFYRRNKSLMLTPEGEKLFNCSQKIFGELDNCLVELSQSKFEKKQLVLSCEPTLSMKWLIPRLSKFKECGYDFDVVLLTGGGQINFEKNNIDMAIRRNDFFWGEHIFSEKIADEYIMVVQSKNFPMTQDLLVSTSRPNFYKNLNRLESIKKVLPKYSKIELEHFYLCLEGCLAGLGATVISLYMIEKELSWGALNKVTVPSKDGSSYYLLSNTDFIEDPRKIIFLNWLKKEMEESKNIHLNIAS